MTERLIKNLISEELFGTRISESAIQSSMINSVYNKLMLEKLLIGQPITIPELRDLLHKKIVNFEFVKLDGNVRPAKGTTMMKHIPKEEHPDGLHPSSEKVAAFYDLSKGVWRSVSNKSKEVVLKKDEETGKPKVVISDKEPKEEVKKSKPEISKVPGAEKRPIPPVAEPIVKPSIMPKAPSIPKKVEIKPEVEEVPLNIHDTTLSADEIQDKDIIAPEEISKPEEQPNQSVEILKKEIEEPQEEIEEPQEEINLPPKEDITFPEDDEEDVE